MITYKPLLSASTVRVFCVSVLVILMVAPGTAAPDGSVTDPEMRPKLVCA